VVNIIDEGIDVIAVGGEIAVWTVMTAVKCYNFLIAIIGFIIIKIYNKWTIKSFRIPKKYKELKVGNKCKLTKQ